MMHDARQSLRAFTRGQTFYFALDQRRQDLSAPQSQAAQNHHRYRDNRARQQRPHEKAAFRKESKHGIHGFRSLDSYRGNDHRFGKIVNGRSTSIPSGGSMAANSSGMGGSCASWID